MWERGLGPAVRWCVLALVIAGACPNPGAAQYSSDEGASFLLVPVGGGAIGLGQAMTAMTGNESAFWNPAGLAATDGSRLAVFRGDTELATSVAASALFSRLGVGTVGVSFLQMDLGDQEYKDRDKNLLGTLSARNHLAVLSVAASLAAGLDVGVNLKYVESGLTCRGLCSGVGSPASSYAVDAGVQYVPDTRTPLRLGAMVANVGPRFQFQNASQADPLPTRVRLALAVDVLDRLGDPELEGWLIVEVQDRPSYAGGSSLFFGSEIKAGGTDALFLRAGYAANSGPISGVGVGIGVRLERLDLSVARSLAVSNLGEAAPFTVSLAVGL